MEKYTRDEVFKEAIKYFNGDTLATDVWINKYSLKDSEGNIYEKTPEDMHRRMSTEFYRIESKYPNPLSEEKIFDLFKNFKYIIPQGGPMSGIGNRLQTVSLSNCFVVGNTSDSYGGIMLIDQEQVQLMKRRGGCIEENTFVYIQDKGLTKIKDVLVGDYILSLNDKTNKNEFKKVTDKFISVVNLDEQIKIKYKNGTILRTSSKHPITTINNNEIKYISYNDGLSNNNIGIKPNNLNVNILNYDEELADIAWFLGAHTGDGSCDKNNIKFRLRINGNNKSVIEHYAKIANTLTNSNCNVNLDNRRCYKDTVWIYTQTNNSVYQIVEKYLDGKYGKKVYNGDIYSFIEYNNLWIPYLAGLIDTDGHIKKNGTIDINICMSKVIDKLSCMLSANNIDLHFNEKISKRNNEKTGYRLIIYRRNNIIDKLIKYIQHDDKKNILLNTCNDYAHKNFSMTYYITDNEYIEIINKYQVIKNKSNNLIKNISLLKKKRKLGIGALIDLFNNNILTIDQYNNILKRIDIIDIIKENNVKLNYYDINVENNHNYFAGNFGLINIHNCGHDLSHIRPKGSPVKNSALTSTGVVPFMERYSNSTREVAQDGRRGALMLSISVKHPDAEDFIDAKMTAGKVTGANISVKLDDEFMNCVLEGKPYKQQYPIDSANPKFVREIDAQKLWKKIVYNAWKSAEPGLMFWDTIAREAIPDCYAEYGFKTVSTNPCFPSSERLLTENGYFKFGDLVTNDSTKTNNVVCDDRISYVDNGDEKPENWKIDNNKFGTIVRKASNVFLTQKNGEVIELKTSKGFKLRCTPDHHIATTRGMIEAKDLTPDDDILISIPNNNGSILNKNPENELEILSLLIGLIQGDGTLDKKRKRLHFDFWGDDSERMKIFVCELIDKLYDFFGERKNEKNKILSKYFISKKDNKIRISSAWVGKIFEEYGFDFKNKFNIPEFIFNNSSGNIGKYYIAALMYCDGSIQGSIKSGYTIRLSQSNESFLNKIQIILHSNGLIFGIYKRRDNKLTTLPNGKGGYSNYKTKDQFELISLGGGIVKYMSSIGFLGDIKKEEKFNKNHNYQIKKSFTDNIISINKLENEPVFCLKENIGRNIIVNGISVRRCGEIPLNPYDSCRLIAINLFSYVENPFTPNAKFNFKLFEEHVINAQRLMDDIVDLEIEKIDEILAKISTDPEPEKIKVVETELWLKIREKSIQGRRTGLGITSEGDMLAALGLTYGTDEATLFSTKVHKALAVNAYKSSIKMAKERGAFGVWNYELEKNNPFVKRIWDCLDSEYKNMWKETGRRNIALLTIAPTGTVSLMTQTTSGIEPCFLPVYTRRRKINPNDKNTKATIIDENGDSFEEYNVFHPKFKMWCEIKGYNIDELEKMKQSELEKIVVISPYYKATSADVDWVNKVKMQGEIQKWVDHSISCTVNLPNEATEELVSKVYQMGWESGCKGITVYRDGSRTGVLVSKKDKKADVFTENNAPKRPKVLTCDVIRFTNKGEKWIGFLGLLDNRPYEIFTGLQEAVSIPNYVTTAEIIKERNAETDGQSRYDVRWIDKDGYTQEFRGLSRAFNREYWNIGRMVSAILRHGMPLPNVMTLLDKLDFGESEYISSWKNGVKRMIKKYIKDGTAIKGQECPNCHSHNLIYKEGCMSCADCGSSKCE